MPCKGADTIYLGQWLAEEIADATSQGHRIALWNVLPHGVRREIGLCLPQL